MNEPIASLIRLQEMDNELESLRQSFAAVAPRQKDIEGQRAGASGALEKAKQALVESQVQRKNLEIEIDTKDQAIRKRSGDLNSVKSNDAYKALMAEIEAAKKEKSVFEDQVLVLMESIENSQKQVKLIEGETQKTLRALDEERQSLEMEAQRVSVLADQKQAERDAFAAGLPGDGRERYEAIRRGRPGFAAVVPVNAMICGGCRTGLTANIVNQVMKGKVLVICDSCSRILYIVPKPEPVPAQPVEPPA